MEYVIGAIGTIFVEMLAIIVAAIVLWNHDRRKK